MSYLGGYIDLIETYSIAPHNLFWVFTQRRTFGTEAIWCRLEPGLSRRLFFPVRLYRQQNIEGFNPTLGAHMATSHASTLSPHPTCSYTAWSSPTVARGGLFSFRLCTCVQSQQQFRRWFPHVFQQPIHNDVACESSLPELPCLNSQTLLPTWVEETVVWYCSLNNHHHVENPVFHCWTGSTLVHKIDIW